MSRRNFIAALAMPLCLAIVAFAENPPPIRDPKALAIVTQAALAMGGPVLDKIGSVQCLGSLAAAPGTQEVSGTFIWLNAFTASSYEFRSELQTKDQDQVFVEGDAGTATLINGKVQQLPSYVSAAVPPVNLPVVVLSVILANPGYTVTLGSPVKIGEVLANHVIVSLDTDDVLKIVTVEDWYFDPGTSLPLRVEFRLPDLYNAFLFTTATLDFANYTAVDEILVPFLIAHTEDGIVNSTTSVTSVKWNYPVTPSDFIVTGDKR